MNNFQYFEESSLEESFVYKTFNNINNVLDTMVQSVFAGVKVKPEIIQEQLLIIKRSRISPLSDRVIEAYMRGDIEIIINPKGVKVPTAIPFVVRKVSTGGLIATIFLSSYATVKTDMDGYLESVDIAPKVLYSLMESAYIAFNHHAYPNKMLRSTVLEKLTMEVYTKMVMRVINRDFSLTIDKDLHDSVMFAVAKFYLTRVWENKNEEVVNTHVLSICVNPNLSAIQSMLDMYNSANIKDISDLLKFLSTVSHRLEKLNIRFFMERYISTYNTSAILSLDYLPYVFYVITSTLTGNFLVSQAIISDITKNMKNINSYYTELNRLV